jgi:two-component system chemotaxis response regulator CheB
MIRVIVAEDSATARALIVEILASDSEIDVIGQACTGREAVDMTLQLRPDLITMDVEMPVLDGLDATREIMERLPTPIVVVSASTNRRDGERSMEALAAGALYVIDKPESPLAPRFEDWRDQLLAAVKAMAHVEVVRRRRRSGGVTPTSVPTGPAVEGPRVRLIGIAASTGGPSALHVILRSLPPSFPLPILIVQHIAHGFSGALAGWLQQGCRVRVRLAEDGEPLRGGIAYLAPDDRQLGVADRTIRLTDAPRVCSFRPSATYLFESLAAEYGSAVAAVILTGMGADGVAGLRRVHAAGGKVFAQDEESCVVFGMPAEAIRAGIVDAVLTPKAIAERLLRLARNPAECRSRSS